MSVMALRLLLFLLALSMIALAAISPDTIGLSVLCALIPTSVLFLLDHEQPIP
jgi:hypothetical protein